MDLIESLEMEIKQLEHQYAIHPNKDFDAGYYAGKIQAIKDFVKLLNTDVGGTPVVIWGEPLRQNNNIGWEGKLKEIFYSNEFGHVDGHEWMMSDESLRFLKYFFKIQLKIQRRICAEKYKYFCHNNFKQLIYDDILNAPEDDNKP